MCRFLARKDMARMSHNTERKLLLMVGRCGESANVVMGLREADNSNHSYLASVCVSARVCVC